MKKIALSSLVIVTFLSFGAYQWLFVPQNTPLSLPPAMPVNSSLPVSTTSGSSTPPPQTPATTQQTPPKKLGPYNDGTYTGNAADAYYGNIQVQAVIQNGKIADVTFLQYPNDRSTSRYINGQAMPYLKEEALQVQNANVNTVSGATDSSIAFQQSLASALSKAQ